MTRAFRVLPCFLVALCGCASRPLGVPPQPTLLRGAAAAGYRLTVESDEGRGPQVLVAEFDLVRDADGEELVVVQRVLRGPAGVPPEPLEIDRDCRVAFGGDADDGPLARSSVSAGDSVADLVPPCASEPLFGAISDIVTFLSVQSHGFGADRLQAVGDEHRFDPFSEAWSRPPHTLDARIDAPGGTLRLASMDGDQATLLWEPDTMQLAIVRQVAAAGGRVLLTGTEALAVEVRCDPRTGELLSGRTVRDDLVLHLIVGYPDAVAPPPEAGHPSGGMPLEIHRRLTLERYPPQFLQ